MGWRSGCCIFEILPADPLSLHLLLRWRRLRWRLLYRPLRQGWGSRRQRRGRGRQRNPLRLTLTCRHLTYLSPIFWLIWLFLPGTGLTLAAEMELPAWLSNEWKRPAVPSASVAHTRSHSQPWRGRQEAASKQSSYQPAHERSRSTTTTRDPSATLGTTELQTASKRKVPLYSQLTSYYSGRRWREAATTAHKIPEVNHEPR